MADAEDDGETTRQQKPKKAKFFDRDRQVNAAFKSAQSNFKHVKDAANTECAKAQAALGDLKKMPEAMSRLRTQGWAASGGQRPHFMRRPVPRPGEL